MNNNNNNKGFSLLELLVGLAISAFVILAAFSLVTVGMNNYKKTSKTTSLQQEVSFTDNMLGEAIRDSSQGNVYIIDYDNNDVELHTGKKVFYYDNDNNSLYVYNEVAGSTYNSNNSDNLVTKYADTMTISFVNSDNDTTLEANNTTYDTSGNKTVKAYSRLVKVSVGFKYKDKSSTSEVTYQIRNK